MCLGWGYRAPNADRGDCHHIRQEQLNHAAGADALGIALGERWAATSTLLAGRRGSSQRHCRLGRKVGHRP